MSNSNADAAFKKAADIDTVAETTLLRQPPSFDTAIERANEAGLPPIAVSPLQGAQLALLARLMNAQHILEIGALGGYSSLWFAEYGIAHGYTPKVTSIEYNPRHAEITKANTAQLDGRVEVITGAALDVLPTLHAEGSVFDFVLLDADWEEQPEYFDWAVKMTRKGGCIYVDNAVRARLEDGVKLFEHVGKDERVTATLVPTMSSRKNGGDGAYDGFLLAVVN